MRLRGRFTVWFTLAALIPIAIAALVTREVLSRSYRQQFDRLRESAGDVARRELGGLEAAVERSAAALADRDHHYVGGLLLDLRKFGAPLPVSTLRRIRDRGAPIMRGLGLDVLLLVGEGGVVIAAPHNRPAQDEPAPRMVERGRAPAGEAFYAREPLFEGNGITRELTVEATATARDGAHAIRVVTGAVIGAEILEPIRQLGRVNARIVGDGGKVWAPPEGDTAAFDRADLIRVPLRGASGEPVAWIEVAISDADLREVLREVSLAAAVLAGLVLLATVLLAYVVAKRMTRDLDELVGGAEAAARGDLDHRVDVRSRDEIGELASAFNGMMTDLRESKTRLAMAERIAAWRDIARRLAHEIKNPLTPIQMAMETLRRTKEKSHPKFDEVFEESTATVLEEAARLGRIVGEFSDFARMPRADRRPCDVNDIVGSAVALYRGTIDIEEHLEDDLPAVEADRDQLIQVIVNLVENARDALSSTENPKITIHTRRARDGVSILIDDNGPGIPEHAREHLFEPYFTTKQETGGTGLGLAIVHRIVTDHGGTITAEPAPTGGARLAVALGSRSTPPTPRTATGSPRE